MCEDSEEPILANFWLILAKFFTFHGSHMCEDSKTVNYLTPFLQSAELWPLLGNFGQFWPILADLGLIFGWFLAKFFTFPGSHMCEDSKTVKYLTPFLQSAELWALFGNVGRFWLILADFGWFWADFWRIFFYMSWVPHVWGFQNCTILGTMASIGRVMGHPPASCPQSLPAQCPV